MTWREALRTKYPDLYAGLHHMRGGFGFECGDGWAGLLADLSTEITERWPTVRATQVKEKFGGLRFYYVGGNAEFRDRLHDHWEPLAYRTCESCGQPGKLDNFRNWVRVQCETCAKGRRDAVHQD